ncbi:SEL1-like repeat protein [Planktotalea sp.]|uniref:SEL1-like repeat protein n=1 Tax=Planktotalea sp. TaxID=2029877 RepID=UPI003298573C
MKSLLLTLAMTLCLANASFAQDHRARFNTIKALEQTETFTGFVDMQSLADEGYAPAMDRLGYYFRQGLNVEQDLVQAMDWYEKAVQAGHPWSTASLARVQIDLNRTEEALALLQEGVRENRPGTHRLLATSHIDRHFGSASDPELGREILADLAQSGDKNAARELVVRVNWGRINASVPDAIVEQVVQAGLDGDERFAEVALVYLSRQNAKSKTALATRAKLADIPGIRDRIRSAEQVRLAAELHPGHFWSHVEDVLSETDDENYAKVASTAFWINKNSWVRVLQKELRTLGYYNGRINGRMTQRTIRAQNRFCRESGIWNICATGPLRGPTVRAVAAEIVKRKSDAISVQATDMKARDNASL